MKNKFLILVSHKKIFSEVGGIESMAKLFLKKSSLYGITSCVVYQGISLSKFVCYKLINSSQSLLDEKDDKKILSENMIIRYPFICYVIKELFFSLIATFIIINIVKKAREKGYIPIIQAFDTGYGGLAAVLASEISNTPLLSLTHGSGQKYIKQITNNKLIHVLDYFIEKFVIENSVYLICVNNESLNYWRIKGIEKTKLKLLRVPINIEVYKNDINYRNLIRAELNIDNDTFVIGYVGRLSPEKNIDILINAFSKIINKKLLPINSKLIIIGDGLLMNSLKNLALKLGIKQNVIFPGFRSDVPIVMNGMDILVLPSSIEGNPTVVLEAMATEIPVILSSIPAHKEIISHLQNGILFNGINELIDDLLLVYQNKELLGRLCKTGREYINLNNNVDKIILEVLYLYDIAISSKKSR